MKAEWILILFLIVVTPALSAAAEPDAAALAGANTTVVSNPANTENCQNLVAVVRDNQAATSRDLRQIKHDLALLRQKLDEPPKMGQIFSGIGYILGLFGVAAFVASRKK